MMTETMYGFLGTVFVILGAALGIAWLFLPWFLMSKMDRMIELLEKIAEKAK
ncbi:MAG: hypothetical protein PHH75_04795 [Candidatus Omnitrophica bacterium]|nr:hypothetical protein [Candidatus Omnitrophota bacterium]MDD5574479.1 hypothetical protein [Candidatus Omnitrophota bacterium]